MYIFNTKVIDVPKIGLVEKLFDKFLIDKDTRTANKLAKAWGSESKQDRDQLKVKMIDRLASKSAEEIVQIFNSGHVVAPKRFLKLIIDIRTDLLKKISELKKEIYKLEENHERDEFQNVTLARSIADIEKIKVLLANISSFVLEQKPTFFQLEFDKLDQEEIDDLIRMERVHPFTPSDERIELRNRLNFRDNGQGAYGLKLGEVLVGVVYFKLSNGTRRNIEHIVRDYTGVNKTVVPNRAIFYTVSALPGVSGLDLNGLSIGESIIRAAGKWIKSKYGTVEKFRTLSPLPGFKAHLIKNLSSTNAEFLNAFLPQPEVMAKIVREWKKIKPELTETAPDKIMIDLLQQGSWYKDTILRELVKEWLMTRVKIYLDKRDPKTGKFIDPVKNLHFGNGASLASINFLGNVLNESGENSVHFTNTYEYPADPKLQEENVQKYEQSQKEFLSKNAG